MRYEYRKQVIESKSKGTFYVLRLCLVDDSGKVLSSSNPVLWLDKETYDLLISTPSL